MSAAARGEAAPGAPGAPRPGRASAPRALGGPRARSASGAGAGGAGGPRREPPGSSGAPEFGALPLLVHPPPRTRAGRPTGRPARPERRQPPEFGGDPPKLGGPEFLSRTWGSPILGPLRGRLPASEFVEIPRGTSSPNCAGWGPRPPPPPGARGPWARPAGGSPRELGEVDLFLPTKPGPSSLQGAQGPSFVEVGRLRHPGAVLGVLARRHPLPSSRC